MHNKQLPSLETVLSLLGQSVFLSEKAQEILSEPLEAEEDSVIAVMGEKDG